MGGPLDTARPPLGTGRPGGRPANPTLSLHCSSYTQDFGKEGFSPYLSHHYGTGYSADLGPAVYYSSSNDLHDNPKLGVSLLDSLQSQTQRPYQQLAVLNGTETLPRTRAQSREGGYLQFHIPSRPRALSCLTEYRRTYVPHRPSPPVCRQHQTVGAKEESGFTEGNSLQPYTFLPTYMHMDRVHQTHSSVTMMDFLPAAFLQGSEMLPRLVSPASRETAFTRDTRNPLASRASLSVRPCGRRLKSSMSAERSIGLKEGSGFVLNTPTLRTLSHTPSDPLHFLTHYQSKFCDPAAFATLKANWTRGGIHTDRDSGYSGRDTDRWIPLSSTDRERETEEAMRSLQGGSLVTKKKQKLTECLNTISCLFGQRSNKSYNDQTIRVPSSSKRRNAALHCKSKCSDSEYFSITF